MIENERVRAEDARSCLLCGGDGVLLYGGLRDLLFDAPGSWSLLQCLKCQLVWLNPRPLPEDIRIIYSQYCTHQVPEASKKSLTGLRKSIEAAIGAYAIMNEENSMLKILSIRILKHLIEQWQAFHILDFSHFEIWLKRWIECYVREKKSFVLRYHFRRLSV